MELFQISESDMQRHLDRAYVDKSISRFDPYFDRLNQLKRKEYKYLHPGVQKTEHLADTYNMTDVRRFRNKSELTELNQTLDNRYFKAKGSAKA